MTSASTPPARERPAGRPTGGGAGRAVPRPPPGAAGAPRGALADADPPAGAAPPAGRRPCPCSPTTPRAGGWPSAGLPGRGRRCHPPVPRCRRRPPGPAPAARRATRPPPGPPRGPRRPPRHGGGPAARRPTTDGGRRRPRRAACWTLVALLGLGLLAPVRGVRRRLGGVRRARRRTRPRSPRWPRSRTPTAPSWPRSGRTTSTARSSPLDQVPEHVRQAVLAAEDRVVLLQPRLRHHRHRAGGVEPAHRRRRRRFDDHPAVREGLHRAGRRLAAGASTRRSCSRSRSPRSRARTRSSRTT